MVPSPYCRHCDKPVQDTPDGKLVHAGSRRERCADGKHTAER